MAQILFFLVLDIPPAAWSELSIETKAENAFCRASKAKKKNWLKIEEVRISLTITYLIKFHKILSIKISIDLWFKCCFHFIELVPLSIFEPRMSLIILIVNMCKIKHNVKENGK